MAKTQAIQLLFNEESRDHKSEIVGLFKNAKRFECLVAFAKRSGWKNVKVALEMAIASEMSARIAIGLNFFHTDPQVLRILFKLSKKYNLELYLSNSDNTFHPKIYAFEYRDRYTVVVGSANFTHGGLSQNYEASVLVDDARGMMMASVTKHFNDLIKDEAIVPATTVLINRYEKDHEINAAWFRFAKRRASRAVASGDSSLDALANFLRLMKEGGAKSNFEVQLKIRRDNLVAAPRQLRSIASWRGKSEKDFLGLYERLISLFHSGGLARQKTRIAVQRDAFVLAVVSIIDRPDLSPHDAFAVLHGAFVSIRGAGINLLTEMLHTLDNKRFAVMNQNSVAGLRLAGYNEFPRHPSKASVSADSYQLYCGHADAVRKALGLHDFTELDALFNYVYWHGNRPDDDEEDGDET
ncbi:phospholipase D-like domain-containing protein [Novosphingobium sp.]|uniref:phospholipase D-like domain-containing protein n=1 Tax=Novosphingobium sp. TaxID=1874826 RepID=UPI0033410378